MKKLGARLFGIDGYVVVIVGLALVLRVWGLAGLPSGFQFDEAQGGYNGWLISKRLENIHGEFLPTDIDYYGDFRPAMQSYLGAVSIKLFGLSEWSVRLPTAFMGWLIVGLSYWLVRELGGEKKVARLAAFLVAVSPMQIVFSRASTDGVVDVFWSLLAIISILRYFGSGKKWWLGAAWGGWWLGYYTYPTSRLLAPMIGLVLMGYGWWVAKARKRVLVLAVAWLALVAFLGWNMMVGRATGRFDQVSVFAYPEVQRQLNQFVSDSGVRAVPPLLVRVFHNKVFAYVRDVGFRYVFLLSPIMVLYEKIQPQRYQIPQLGLVALWEYVGAVTGVYYLAVGKIRREFWLIVALVLLAPLPSAVTFEAFPNIQRAIYLAGFLPILAALGWWAWMKHGLSRASKGLLVMMLAILGYGAAFYAYQYAVIAPVHEPYHRDYEMKALAEFLGDEGKQYPRIGISSWHGPDIFYLFFNRLDVADQEIEKPGKYFEGNFRMNNLEFLGEKCLGESELYNERYDLVVQVDGCPEYEFLKKVREFARGDGSVALRAYEVDEAGYGEWREGLQRTGGVN